MLGTSLDGLVTTGNRGCRRLDGVDESCACDFAERSGLLSGDSGSLIEAGSGGARRSEREAAFRGEAVTEVAMATRSAQARVVNRRLNCSKVLCAKKTGL